MEKTTKYCSYMTPQRNKHHRQLVVEEEHAVYLAAITIVDKCLTLSFYKIPVEPTLEEVVKVT